MGLKLKEKIIVEIGHVTEIYGPVQALMEYFNHNDYSLYYVAHPLKEGNIDYSGIYFNKQCIKKIIKLRNEYIQYVRELFVNLIFLIRLKGEINLYIGMSSFDTLPAIILKKLRFKKIHNVVFYTVDYSDKKFNNLLLNKLYQFLDLFCAKHSDFVFSNSKRTSEIRAKQGVKKEENIIVRNGVYLEKIPCLSITKDANKMLYFVGHLSKAHGVQEVIQIINEVSKLISDIKLIIIGSGPYEEELKQLVIKNKLFSNVVFLGRLENEDVLKILATGGIGLSPYNLEESWVKYCDPVKVKEYLACGCPVIISNIPEIADEIERNKAGFSYSTIEGLKKAIITLACDPDKYFEYRKNAIKMGQKYDWNKIYDIFSKLQ